MDSRILPCGCTFNPKSPKNNKWTFCKEAERLLLISRKYRKEYKYRQDYEDHFQTK